MLPASPDITGIVLVGGNSVRMGTPKATLLFHGRPLLHRIVDALTPVTGEVLIVAAAGQQIEVPLGPNIRVVRDVECGRRPLMGLYSGLSASSTDLQAVVACDMPFVHGGLLALMGTLADGYDAVIAMDGGRPQPLHAIYRRSCRHHIEHMLASDDLRLTSLSGRSHTRYVERAT